MKERVIFICSSNSARSQMAEALLRKYGGDRFDAYSAGVDPKELNPFAIKAMREVGIDISTQESKSVSLFLGAEHFQYVITVCDEAERNCPTCWPGIVTRLHWSFEDPAAFDGTETGKLEKFREVRDQIEKRIVDWLNR